MFVTTLLRAVALLPALITGVEGLFGRKRGEEKKENVVSIIGLILGLSESISGKDIVDEKAFQEGLRQTIDGTVKMLNASVWAKKS